MAFRLLNPGSTCVIMICIICAVQLLLVLVNGEENVRKFGLFRRPLPSPPPPPTGGLMHGMLPPEAFNANSSSPPHPTSP